MPVPSISPSFLTACFTRLSVALIATFLTAGLYAWAQLPGAGSSSLHGTVRDLQGRAVAHAQVQLQTKDSRQVFTATTDSQGVYRFSNLQQGNYVLRVVSANGSAEIASLALGEKENKTVDLNLRPEGSEQSAQAAPQFYDEPQFTVSGVTDTTNLGGHGSDTVVRTRETLAKETATLAQPGKGVGGNTATESSLREALQHDPASFEANHQLGMLLLANDRAEEAVPYLRRGAELQPRDAEVHHALGDAEEKRGDPLEAVRQYQRAAELDPSETYLFDWGAELLLHHAPEPAVQVFTKGNTLYPKSVRILIGLGAAWFARGANDQAVQKICEASDLNPGDSKPYVFLGKMLRAESKPSPDELEKLQRFVTLEPQNAEANYYYAVALWKSRKDASDPEIAHSESLLQRAVQLNPKFAAAHLQLGIVHQEEQDYRKAISEYQRAIQIDPQLEEAHFRLGQAYRQTGDVEKSKEELRIHQQLAKESAQQVERERHEIRQFVYTLRDQGSQNH
ncbi:MAG TPA: tetratricopeptide repeat protein [Candidatus Sulfotelmatobacter sp.]|nr:tetratricopeptide repeat protein [Candidatus Sulfotelmatobacter sp.]